MQALWAGRALGFFQLEMQGGIFQSCWSFTLTARGGECITGTGGEPGPLGTCGRGSTALVDLSSACKNRV